jgi:NTP pyrophosphatase (non-canonical NTP hydrolase)
MNSYQKAASEMATKHPNLDTLFIGLSAEVGELCSERMRENRDDRTAKGIGEITTELGDILWYVAVIAAEYNLDLSEVASENLKKLNKRKETNYVS